MAKNLTKRLQINTIDFLRDIMPEKSPKKLGRDYEGEIIINSRGNYIYSCVCGVDSSGNLKEINMHNLLMECYQCGKGFILQKYLGEGPRVLIIEEEK